MKRLCFFSFVVVLSVHSINAHANAHAVESQKSTSDESSNVEAIYQQALLNARNDAEISTKDLNWFFGGFCCGIFGPLYAVLDTPNVPSNRLLGKSPEYVSIYTNEFQAKTRARRIRFSIIGGSISALMSLAIYLSI